MNDQRVWQVAAGDTNRAYHDLCLRWDVILLGPGYAGAWPNCAPVLRQGGWTGKKIGIIKRFSENIQDRDLIVLRLGTSKIYGVGQAIGPCCWLDAFGDVDGWDLQHVRRVRWLWRYYDETDRKPKVFPPKTLKFGDTIQKMDSEKVLVWIKNLKFDDEQKTRPLVELPYCCYSEEKIEKVDIRTVADYLFDAGVAADSIDTLVSHMDDLRRIASWYTRNEIQPSESETVAYLVVPLLRALGWTPQRMAVEWNKVDLALFDYMPREDTSLSIVAEVKAMDKSCLTAQSQARGYAEQEGRERCQRLIVTDGIRYGIYLRQEVEQTPAKSGSYKLAAYLNLTRMMDDYPILECKGAKEALRLMAADWRSTPSP